MTLRSRFYLLGALVLVVTELQGCFGSCGPDPGPGPCEADQFACEDNLDEFSYDDSCTLTGELEVEIGYGETAYTELVEGASPQIYQGFQGGQHMFVAVRVMNADLDQYSVLRAEFQANRGECEPTQTDDGSGSGAPAFDDAQAFDTSSDAGESDAGVSDAIEETAEFDATDVCAYPLAERTVVLGGQHEIRTNAVGDVEEYGIMLILNWWPTDEVRTLSVNVEDPCRRSGLATHSVPAGR